MTAREKLQNLTMLWIAYSVVTSGVMFFVRGGFGFWSIAISAGSLLLSLGLNVAIGSALLNRNGLVRGLIALLAGGATVLGTIALGKLCLLFVTTWSFGLFVPFLALTAVIAMNAHSLRVLFSRNVRRYFG